jgi:hypothetical protein
MTTDAERDCYYRLAKEAAPKGTIIELGAWMGASTAYIAAGIRDSGADRKALVFDKFQSKPGHIRKVKEFYSKRGIDKAPVGPCMETFMANLGGLMRYVEPRQGQIERTIALPWADNSVSLLVTDAPKRVPQISPVLTALRNPGLPLSDQGASGVRRSHRSWNHAGFPGQVTMEQGRGFARGAGAEQVDTSGDWAGMGLLDGK